MYTIRLATLADLPQIRMLWKAFAEEPRDYPINMAGATDTFTRQLAMAMAQVPTHVFCFLAEDEGAEPLGFFLYEIQNRFIGEPTRYGFVHCAYVVPDRRKEGIITALAEMGCEHGLAQGLIYCEASHRPTEHFWERFGTVDYDIRCWTTGAKILSAIDRGRARRLVEAERGNGLDQETLESKERHDGSV